MKTILFKKMAAIIASAVIAASMTVTANAEENNTDTAVNTDTTSTVEKVGKYTKDELHEMLFDLSWEDSEVGEENPLASIEYKWIGEWLDKYYGKSQLSAAIPDKDFIPAHWDRDSEITDAWTTYRFEIMQTFDADEDPDGNYYMQSYDPETGDELERYDFNFNEEIGMWELIDKDGNIYDRFEPHGGEGVPSREEIESHVDEFLRESGERQRGEEESADETYEADTTPETNDGEDNASTIVTGTVAEQADTVSRTAEEPAEETADEAEEKKESKSVVPLVIGGGAVAAIAAAVFVNVKGKGKKK